MHGKQEVDVYLVSIFLPNGVGVKDVTVTLAQLDDIDVLLGMDIIVNGDFVVTNHGGKTRWSFRLPSVGPIDFVREINDQQLMQTPKLGRNDPCHCGSGKKFKKCHGK